MTHKLFFFQWTFLSIIFLITAEGCVRCAYTPPATPDHEKNKSASLSPGSAFQTKQKLPDHALPLFEMVMYVFIMSCAIVMPRHRAVNTTRYLSANYSTVTAFARFRG